MEAVILADDSSITFEPLSSYICISELYIGTSHIYQETLENLWRSGISVALLVVPKHVSHKFKRFCRAYSFGKKERALTVELVAINVNCMQVGPALRELAISKSIQGDFILLHWDTLLTVPLYEAMDLHQRRKKLYSQYAQSVLYIKDFQDRRFSSIGDDSMVLMDGNQELMYCDNDNDHINLSSECSSKFRKLAAMELRFDLCQTHVYICTNRVIEYFTEWFDKCQMQDFIQESLTQEIKTNEIYITILESDFSFANFPAALRINTPRLYYNVYMAYIQRFQGTTRKTLVPPSAESQGSCHGPKIRESCNFINGGAYASYFEPQVLENIQGCVVGKNCHVGPNSKITNSVLFDGVFVGSNCTINGTILMDRVVVDDGVVLEQGSIIGSNCKLVNDENKVNGCIPSVVKEPLYCATFASKFINLGDSVEGSNEKLAKLEIVNAQLDQVFQPSSNAEEQQSQIPSSEKLLQTNHVNQPNGVLIDTRAREAGDVNCQNINASNIKAEPTDKPGYYAWDMLPFLERRKLYRIKDEFWNFVVITRPVATNDYSGDSDAEYDQSSDSFLLSNASSSGDGSHLDDDLQENCLNDIVKQEIGVMVMECLENPVYLSDKMLEIRSIKISQNLDESQVMLACLYSGLLWVISKYERLEDDDECLKLQATLDQCRLADLISSFRVPEEFDECALYRQVELAVEGAGKAQTYLGRIFEALYQCEVICFDSFYDWIKSHPQIKDDRLCSFAEWLATD